MKNELGGHKEAEAYWNEAELHIQARYCNILGRSLSTKIKIERVEEINYLDVSINEDFSLYGKHAMQLLVYILIIALLFLHF